MLPATTGIDFYKADHRSQYPRGTEVVFSNWTARKSRIPGIQSTIHFGLQYYVKEHLQHRWDETFFKVPKKEAVARYARRMKNAGINVTVEHFEALHDLGYLPIEIWTLPAGTRVPIGVP